MWVLVGPFRLLPRFQPVICPVITEFLDAYGMVPLVPYVMDERLRKLLAAIAQDIGIADELRSDDLGRVYHPIIRREEQFIEDVQRRQRMMALSAQGGAQQANTVWPPKPD